MPEQEAFLNKFSVTYTTTAGGQGFSLGFQAHWFELVNDGPVGVFLNVNSTNPATTSDYLVRAGEFYSATLIDPLSGFGLNTSTTSTVAGDMPTVRVFAAGG